MSEEEPTLEEKQAALTSEYLELREAAADDKKAARKASRLETKLDGIYWKRVEEILSQRVSPDKETLDFNDEERLLIDMGLIDMNLVKDAPEDLVEKLLAELNQTGDPNHFYMTEWLEDRYRRHKLAQDATSGQDSANEQQDSPLVQARQKVLSRLTPFFKDLPGVPKEMAAVMLQGNLDEQVLGAGIALLHRHDRRSFLFRSRLRNLRWQILARARSRTNEQNALKLFDALDDIYSRSWRERYATHQKEGTGAGAGMFSDDKPDKSEEERAKLMDFLAGELHFVKSLMPLGALAGGVTRSCAVLFSDQQRVTKEDTAYGLTLARSCDRGYAHSPVVLIAPFRGRGIFEWDRDSFVISLVPAQDAEDSVANSVANFRMLTDSLQDGGKLKSAYEEKFQGENFQQSFQADYRAWVTCAGKGDASKMDEDRKNFFRDMVGPDCNDVLAPANLRNLGPQARQGIMKRLQKQIATAEPDAQLHYRLGVLSWQENKLDAALNFMAAAAKIDPQDGILLLSLGLILRQLKRESQSKGMFTACIKRVPQTIWRVYAEDLLAGKL